MCQLQKLSYFDTSSSLGIQLYVAYLHVAYREKDACIRVHFHSIGKYSGQFYISWNSKSTKKTNIARTLKRQTKNRFEIKY